MAEIDRKTIFIVDDDEITLAICNEVLHKYYNVVTLKSGGELLKKLEKSSLPPDLILLDVEIADMSGYEIIKLLKENKETKNIPVIFLTVRNDEENELKGLSLGAIDYIVKPFSSPLLLKRIELHLELIGITNNLQKLVEEKTKTIIELKNAVLNTFTELIDCRDDVTGDHIDRTQKHLQVLIEAALSHPVFCEEIKTWDIDLLLQSAQLHDVGKIAIDDIVLKKQEKLTKEEFEHIKLHVSFGEEVIEKITKKTSEQDFLKQAKILIATHHEKWDGSGYPRGLKGEEIPLQGRMMAIVDVYDALISNRPYKKAFTHKEAVDIIAQGKGSHFDPALVEIFISVNDKFRI